MARPTSFPATVDGQTITSADHYKRYMQAKKATRLEAKGYRQNALETAKASGVKGVDAKLLANQRALKQFVKKSPTAEGAPLAHETRVNKIKENISTLEDRKEYKDATQAAATKAGGKKLISGALSDPASVVPKADVEKIKVDKGHLIDPTKGQVKGEVPVVDPSLVTDTAKTTDPTKITPAKVDPTLASGDVKKALDGVKPAVGTVSDKATGEAATVKPSKGAIADESVKVDPSRVDTVEGGTRKVTEKEMVEAAGKDAKAVKVDDVTSDYTSGLKAVTEDLDKKAIADAATMDPKKVAQAEDTTKGATLSEAAIAKTPTIANFTVDDGTLAEFTQGSVSAKETVRGQLEELMKSFNDGTPAWAAGAIRGANAAMASRGMGRSSMAGAAILQAAMESALPIAQADAQAFQQMNLNNLNRGTQIALANAAASQGLELARFSAKQQTALQNSAKAADFDTSKLSLAQQTAIANAQIRAAAQESELDRKTTVSLANAAKYADLQKINLNWENQIAIAKSSENLQVDLANLSTKSQKAIAEAQLAAALQGQVLDNKQQAAVLNAQKFAEANNMTFTAKENAALHNSELLKTIGLAELGHKSAAVLQNAATLASMDVTNATFVQQMAQQNAKAFLEMDLTNLSNKQQTEIFKAQGILQGIFNDQSFANAAKNFNAESENDVNKFFEGLKAEVGMSNTAQTNAMKQFNAGEKNAFKALFAEMKESRARFETENSVAIASSNATWRRDVDTINTAAVNQANRDFALGVLGMTGQALDNMWQRERDIMSYAFQAGENELERNLKLFLSDKEFDLIKDQMEDAEEAGRGRVIANLMSDIADNLFGGDGFF